MLPMLCLALAAPPNPDPSADFFDPAKPVRTVRIDVDKPNLEQLRKEPRKYVKMTLTSGDQKWTDVGVHLKGAAGSYRDWNDRPALTLNADKFNKKNTNFFGLDKFHFNNSVQDWLMLNEAVCSDLCNKNNVPAPRVGHAIVHLGERKMGLYVVKEGFDKQFLKRHFENADGNLYDGGFLQDIEANLELDLGKPCEWKDLRELVAAARETDHKKRLEKLDAILDLKRFYKFWAIEVLCGDWDGYCRNRNNYRLYRDPTTKKFVMFCHGKDQLFQNPGDAIVHGWNGLLARKLFDTDEGRKQYYAALNELCKKDFTKDALWKVIDAQSAKIKLAQESIQKGSSGGYGNELNAYKERVKQRVEFCTREAAKLK
jgi:spore coat protein H